jgi:hypothetical protein
MNDMKHLILFTLVLIQSSLFAQEPFLYRVELSPIQIPGFTGLHSYAFGTSDSLIVFIGGRRDGLHARQPFNAFPESYNNDSIYVLDINNQIYWSRGLDELSTPLQEQLQSSNMVFYQDDDTLIMIGGYSYSQTNLQHITFPSLISVNVDQLVDSIVNDNSLAGLFKQLTTDYFAVTGGQLGKIDDTFLLVGGHRFDGSYNPMNNPTFVQTYTNSIRKFKLNNSGSTLVVNDSVEFTDALHLHRRDYNLMPYLFTNGDPGYLISSGVFQTGIDLPFLYPVEIDANSINPVTSFDQKLSNYHSAKVSLYDSLSQQLCMLFFGGIASYYYDGSTLVYDDKVPFVNTISMVIRANDGSFYEYKMLAEMPQLHGSSAEFIPNMQLGSNTDELLHLSEVPLDTVLIGHIYGGIYSPSINPFSNNQTTTTSASDFLYRVELIYDPTVEMIEVPTNKSSEIKIYPNPTKNKFFVEYNLTNYTRTRYVIATANGEIVQEGYMENEAQGINVAEIKLERSIRSGTYLLSLIFDEKMVTTAKLVIE